MGGDRNRMILVTDNGETEWPEMPKTEAADRLADAIADALLSSKTLS
jgi:phosphopantothenoylcysteine decarboxylase/phosphopantothenate--cysteine ligase